MLERPKRDKRKAVQIERGRGNRGSRSNVNIGRTELYKEESCVSLAGRDVIWGGTGIGEERVGVGKELHLKSRVFRRGWQEGR